MVPRSDFGAGEQFDSISLAEDIYQQSSKDLVVLKAIGGDAEIENLSFQGIRRKLGVHQETLSRALHRLQRDGLIEKFEHSYRLSPKGKLAIALVGSTPLDGQERTTTILQAMLPEGTRTQNLLSSLAYKWFGKLRWLGSSVAEGSTTLSWITDESDLKISIRIRKNALAIEASAAEEELSPEVIHAAYWLFDHVSRSLKGDHRQQLAEPTYARAA